MLTESDRLLLVEVHKGSSYREMAKAINRSLGIVQRRILALEESGHVVAPENRRLARARRLSEKGKRTIRVD